MTSTPTRPVDNVVITTKGLQDRNINILDGTTVENKGKLIKHTQNPTKEERQKLKTLLNVKRKLKNNNIIHVKADKGTNKQE